MAIDVMLDLETLGTSAGCVILSIGAIPFDLSKKFYEKISVQDSLTRGFHRSHDTVKWWDKQDPLAKEEAFSGKFQAVTVLGAFSDYLRSFDDEIFLWGNGADFDLPILAHYYDKLGMKRPWKPYNGRCYRTLKNLYRESVPAPPFSGMKHSAIEDAVHQATHAHMILKVHFSK